jgi:hypothetical protein
MLLSFRCPFCMLAPTDVHDPFLKTIWSPDGPLSIGARRRR